MRSINLDSWKPTYSLSEDLFFNCSPKRFYKSWRYRQQRITSDSWKLAIHWVGISFYWLQPPDDGWAVKRRTCNSIKVLDTTHIFFSLNGKCTKVKKNNWFFYAKADGMNSSLDWLNISDYEFLSCCQSRCIRWHLWCWGLMHIDRTSTKSHDMLTTRLCIRGILRFYQLGHRCLFRRDTK